MRVRLALLSATLVLGGGLQSVHALPPGVEEAIDALPIGPFAANFDEQANFSVDIEAGLLGITYKKMDSSAAVPTQYFCDGSNDLVARVYTVECLVDRQPYFGVHWQCVSPWVVASVTSPRPSDAVTGRTSCNTGAAECTATAALSCSGSISAQTLQRFTCTADYANALLALDWRVHCATIDP